MRVAVTGTTGRVGAALARHLAGKHQVIPLPRSAMDLADPDAMAKALARLKCDVFINPAGITSLEVCEAHPDLAMRVNAEAPAELAAWAARGEVRVIHFSTDYVFGGEEAILKNESHPPAPKSVYGRSKLAGEEAVLAHPGNLVVRVSWVFGPEKPSFVDQIYDAALQGKPLAAIADKFSLPVFTEDLAHWIGMLIEGDAGGLLHACNPGDPVSWHGMAEHVVREMVACGVIGEVPEIAALSLAEMTSFKAVRPWHTAMNTHRLSCLLGNTPRCWPDALTRYIRIRCA